MKKTEDHIRLLLACVVAASISTCGVVGTTDLRLDRERRKVQELRVEYIDTMNEMVDSQIRFLTVAESLAVRSLLR